MKRPKLKDKMLKPDLKDKHKYPLLCKVNGIPCVINNDAELAFILESNGSNNAISK